MTQAVSPIRISDEDFLIASTIERCPKVMMIRELVMNALEAAREAPIGHRRVEISSTVMNGVSKLSIWNTGPGMTGQELHDACDLASSIRKAKGLDENFGMGAKVASLPSNRYGLRYRSCSNRRVHEVILCKREQTYGRLRRKQEDGTYAEVIDVTEIAQQAGASLDLDWTEVLLLGNRLEQDTVRDPYDGDPDVDGQWLATYLYHRFYNLGTDVKLTLHTGTHKLGPGSRTFHTIPDRARLNVFEQSETVFGERDIRIHYIYDAPYAKGPGHNRSISGAIQSAVSTCAVVYKGEMYDVRKGQSWTLDAPIFGVPFGARHISVHVELPDSYPVRPEGYRQFLRRQRGEQEQVNSTDFAELVARHRPQWLIDLIRSFAPDSPSHDEIRKELQKLLDDLRVLRNSPRTHINGSTSVSPDDGPAVESAKHGSEPSEEPGTGDRHVDLSIAPQGSRRADIWQNRERAPIIIPLTTEAQVEEKQLKERAGRYYDNGQLFVNMLYPSVRIMAEQLEREYANAVDIEQVRIRAKQLADQTIMLRVGRAVVYALAKQLNKEWNSDAVKQALAPESLSLAADDFQDSLQNARRKMGITFRTSGEKAPVASIA